MMKGKIACPNADQLDVKEAADANFAKHHARFKKKGKGYADKLKWGEMSEKGKRHFAEALLSNPRSKNDFVQYIKEAQEMEEEANQVVLTQTKQNATLLPAIPVFNFVLWGPSPLSVKLDGDLPHISLVVGGAECDNLETEMWALMDTGAGATIGWLHFKATILVNVNPSMWPQSQSQ